MNLKIGLIGAPRAGKDTFADFLIKFKGFKKLAFADQIKKEYFLVSNFTEEHFKGTSQEQMIRDDLWAYSDKMRKDYGDLHFINPVIKEMVECSENVVITDIRTVNELLEVKKTGAFIIIIIRDLKLDILKPYEFPGTRLNFIDILGIPVLLNCLSTIDDAYLYFEAFYNKIIKKEKKGPNRDI